MVSQKSIPDVSVCLITYNQQAFVGQAIESVLMQQANFPYELVIGEDCSTDGTRAICERFAASNPDRVRLLPPDRNLGMIPNVLRVLEACRAEYVAFLEGDDYWTYDRKLQEQVDFLNMHPEYSACGYSIQLADVSGAIIGNNPNEPCATRDVSLKDICRHKPVPCLTLMYRRDKLPPQWREKIRVNPHGDIPLIVMLSQEGKIRFFKKTAGVYRTQAGVWGTASTLDKVRVLQRLLDNIHVCFKPENAGVLSRYKKRMAFTLSRWLYVGGFECLAKGEYALARKMFMQSFVRQPSLLCRFLRDESGAYNAKCLVLGDSMRKLQRLRKRSGTR